MLVSVGVFGQIEQTNGSIYAGARVGAVRLSATEDTPGDDDDESSRTDLLIAPTIGAEHFLGESFSVGGELGLQYRMFGEGETNGDENYEGGDLSRSLLQIAPQFFVRFYF